jgi:hypothetical protein
VEKDSCSLRLAPAAGLVFSHILIFLHEEVFVNPLGDQFQFHVAGPGSTAGWRKEEIGSE